MKPLSPLLYSTRNKKKNLASINAVILAVSFLYILYSFMQSIMVMEEKNNISLYKNAAKVMSCEQKPIESSLIEGISKNENVDKIIPTSGSYGIRFSIPGSADIARAVPLRTTDMDYFMKKQDIKLIEGKLPGEGFNEIAISKNIAKNRNIKIGDKVGDSIYKFDSLPGEYLIVGILDSDSLVSILSANDNIFPNYKNEEINISNSFYVFPKDGKKNAMDTYISSLPKKTVNVYTESIVSKEFERSAASLKVMDVISILSIIVMVVTVGSSKYVQYINRNEELGVLNAIGYNKSHILSRTFEEVILTNLLGFILGITLGFITAFVISKGLWEPKGAEGFLFTTKGFVVSVFVPLFTILFSIIPINNLINKLDPIKMIEKN